MPATEQTWRNLTLLHKVFAISAVAMLVATIWMFVADHNREWKPYQSNANRVEITLAQWRKLQYATDEAQAALAKLEEELQAEREAPIPSTLVEQFQAALGDDAERRRNDAEAVHRDASSESQVAGINARIDAYKLADGGGYGRGVIEAVLRPLVKRARFRETDLLSRRKFKMANLDAVRAKLGLAVRDARSEAEMDQVQAEVDQLASEVDLLTLQYQAAAATREKLQKLVGEMTAREDQLVKDQDEALREANRLTDAVRSRRSNYVEWAWGVVPVPGKKWLEMPILDAFNSPLKVENLWADGLTQDYVFRKVRRFDRCTTCHKAIDKTMPGSPTEQAYIHERLVDLTLTVPSGPEPEVSSEGRTREQVVNARLEKAFGLQLAAEGLVDRDAVTVEYVRAQSPAAQAVADGSDTGKQSGDEIRNNLLQSARVALGQSPNPSDQDPQDGLLVGDVIVAIDGDPVVDRSRVSFRLLDALSNGGKPLRITVRRGLPHPYASHPRLDLFVGSMSPHKLADFACTVCHDGQGSATTFKWASHSPNDMTQSANWSDEHGWFDNPHWIYPMYPKRFAEAACLKCHHEVVELMPSERFPVPPAPTVTHGYDLVRKYGCYGCHEINGYAGADTRVGPDMRLEPNFFAAAQAIKLEPGSGFDKLDDEQKDWIEQLIQHPDRNHVRHEIYQMILQDDRAEKPVLSVDVRSRIAPLLKDVETPGAMRKSGPALRFVKRKLDDAFLADWLKNPTHFRPTTRMPRFFGMWDHLDEPSLHTSQQYEPVEVLGMLTYLQDKSQQFDYLEQPATDSPALDEATAASLFSGPHDETQQQMIVRGRQAFQERGCLACHPHKDFPDAEQFREPGTIIQGPDLSAIGTKFAPQRNPTGARWLYSWIKQPTRYHVRTVMPDLYLDPVESKTEDGKVLRTDPVADIVGYLLASSQSDWKPDAPDQLSGEMGTALDSLALEYLKDAFYVRKAEDYLKTGIPSGDAPQVKGAERELVVDQGPLTEQQKLLYVGRKTIARYGCYGCHDIPGFEDAKSIGTGLADWGRKETSKLAFEHINQYLHEGHAGGHGHGGHASPAGESPAAKDGDAPDQGGAGEAGPGHDAEAHASAHEGQNDYGELPEFYKHHLEAGHREGFLYQKLREPRSYDYHKTRNKKYGERLRMPLFGFNEEEREAVVTFVLGLVADPPGEKYLYQPDERQSALLAGRVVLDKYNCGSCHLLEAERWKLAFDPEWEVFGGSSGDDSKVFPFLRTHFTPEQLAASEQLDRRGLQQAEVRILPVLAARDGKPAVSEWNSEEFVTEGPVSANGEYRPTGVSFDAALLQATPIAGQAYSAGGMLRVPGSTVEEVYPGRGGFLAKYLLPSVTARVGNDRGAEAWGWVPPMLVGEGEKAQSEWLHDFLLNPQPIRPAVVLRMPRFNMSPDEATRLVHYFAARDQADYPYQFASRRQRQRLEREDEEYGRRLDPQDPPRGQRLRDAMNIVIDKKVYCAQCHQIGDYYPEGVPTGHGPDLTKVNRRLRAEYVRNWVANPKTILPYTAMPVNIAYDESMPNLGTKVPQDFFHGNSLEQLSGVVDLLMNLDVYLETQASFAEKVRNATPAAAPAESPSPAATGTGADVNADAKAADASEGKPGDAKPEDAKPEDAKPGDAKPGDAKPGDAKPDEVKPDNTEPGNAKPDSSESN